MSIGRIVPLAILVFSVLGNLAAVYGLTRRARSSGVGSSGVATGRTRSWKEAILDFCLGVALAAAYIFLYIGGPAICALFLLITSAILLTSKTRSIQSMIRVLATLHVFLFAFWLWVLVCSGEVPFTYREICLNCGRFRFRKEPSLVWNHLRLPGSLAKPCSQHDWSHWLTMGESFEIGKIILLRQNGRYAAIRPLSTAENIIEYEWRTTKAGGPYFDRDVESGKETSSLVQFAGFGPIYVWGKYLSYHYLPDQVLPSGAVAFCCTDLNSLEGVDASDEQWVYWAYAHCAVSQRDLFGRPLRKRPAQTALE